MNSKMKSHTLLSSFIEYCLDHPDQRFWQALRNWSGYNTIFGYKSNELLCPTQLMKNLEDTFYKEGK